MSITKFLAVLILFLVLIYWKFIVLAFMGALEDYELWAKLKDKGVEERSFIRYWLDEC